VRQISTIVWDILVRTTGHVSTLSTDFSATVHLGLEEISATSTSMNAKIIHVKTRDEI